MATKVPTRPRNSVPAYRRIADAIREEILLGKCPPGTQMPSTGELAIAWNASSTTIHNALIELAKEGWIQRLSGAGTFVADPGRRFLCAGIYHSSDIFANESSAFSRSLHTCLLEQFAKIGKSTQVFIDTRPMNEQFGLPATLTKAIADRRIQCLVTTWANPRHWKEFARLNIPTAFLSNPESGRQVTFDPTDILRHSASRLAAEGCKSIGILSTASKSSRQEELASLFPRFVSIMRGAGIETRNEWMLQPREYVQNAEVFGYEQFLRFWSLKEKPTHFIAMPDDAVRGVILALMQVGMKKVTREMKFIFHHNARAKIICPFEATWAISDESTWAEWAVRLIEKQFNGEKVASMTLPYQFETRTLSP